VSSGRPLPALLIASPTQATPVSSLRPTFGVVKPDDELSESSNDEGSDVQDDAVGELADDHEFVATVKIPTEADSDISELRQANDRLRVSDGVESGKVVGMINTDDALDPRGSAPNVSHDATIEDANPPVRRSDSRSRRNSIEWSTMMRMRAINTPSSTMAAKASHAAH